MNEFCISQGLNSNFSFNLCVLSRLSSQVKVYLLSFTSLLPMHASVFVFSLL